MVQSHKNKKTSITKFMAALTVLVGGLTASVSANDKMPIKPAPLKIASTEGGEMRRTGDVGAVVRVVGTARSEKTETSKPKKRKVAAKRKNGSTTANKSVKRTARRDAYKALIRAAAKKYGVPVHLAHAVVQVESNFNPKARGGAGEVGLMQIKPATARGMGYRGSVKALYDPKTNLEWGMRYLAGAHKRASGDTCGTILRYNAGHYAKRMNPISRRYCQKVKRILAST